MIPVLQYRWQIEYSSETPFLVYYGLRNPPKEKFQKIPLDIEIADIIQACDGKRTLGDLQKHLPGADRLNHLISEEILVDLADRKTGPASLDQAQTCTRCVNNDYLLPGLEFDEKGVCAFCQCYERGSMNAKNSIPIFHDEELKQIQTQNTDSRFDVMLLYTGGKDTSYLLWYLAKKLHLRVLAASWTLPDMNESVRRNILQAKKHLTNVEFVEMTLPWDLAKEVTRSQVQIYGLPCLCPNIAYALLYPLAFEENIPYIVNVVEEVRMSVRDHIFPIIQKNQSLTFSEREETLSFLQYLLEDRKEVKPLDFITEIANTRGSFQKQLPEIYQPLAALVIQAEQDPSVSIPLIRRIQTHNVTGEWNNVVDLLTHELGWELPDSQTGPLYSRCSLETVKDYLQSLRFTYMRTTHFPQSILEISASVFFGLISREKGLIELAERGYFSRPDKLVCLLRDLQVTSEKVEDHTTEVPSSICRKCCC